MTPDSSLHHSDPQSSFLNCLTGRAVGDPIAEAPTVLAWTERRGVAKVISSFQGLCLGVKRAAAFLMVFLTAGHFMGNNTVLDVIRREGYEVEYAPAG